MGSSKYIVLFSPLELFIGQKGRVDRTSFEVKHLAWMSRYVASNHSNKKTNSVLKPCGGSTVVHHPFNLKEKSTPANRRNACFSPEGLIPCAYFHHVFNSNLFRVLDWFLIIQGGRLIHVLTSGHLDLIPDFATY